MSKLMNIYRKLTKRSKAVIGTLSLLVIVAVPVAVMAGYGPNGGDRVVFDYSNPSQNGGAFDGPRFNSFINTDVYGDERAFLDTKECVTNSSTCYSNGVGGGYTDVQTVTAGKEYIIRAYVHNNANPSINDNPATPEPLDGIGTAINTRIRFELPTGIANGFTAQARISADNSIPSMVYDTVDFKNDSKSYSIEYIPGSAYIFNASHPDGLNLNDEIMSNSGTLLGDNEMNGIFPGCFNFSSFVVIRVKVKAPDLEIQKLASLVDMPTMADTSKVVSVKRGENVSWRINYKNSGTDVAQNVVLRDELPAGLTIVPGSINLTTAAGSETLQDTALGSGGVDVGDYFAEGNGVIRFTTTVNTEPGVCELTNIAFVRGVNITEVSDTAKVVIEDCAPPKVVVCTSLVANKLIARKGESVLFTANATASNTTITGYTFKLNGNIVQTGAGNTYTLIQDSTNSQIVTVIINSPIGDVSSAECSKVLESENFQEPVYSCEQFILTKNDRNVAISFLPLFKNGATFKDTTIKYIADGVTADEATTNILSESKIKSDYTFSDTAKKVTAIAVLRFNVTVNNTTTVKDVTCQGTAVLGFNTPSEIPDTGAGSNLILMLLAVAGFASFAHRKFTLKRQ